MDTIVPFKFSLSPNLTSSSRVIHSLLQSNVHFLMEAFSPGDIKEELREFEERCGVFFFAKVFYLKKENRNKGLRIEIKELSPGRSLHVSPELACKKMFFRGYLFLIQDLCNSLFKEMKMHIKDPKLRRR